MIFPLHILFNRKRDMPEQVGASRCRLGKQGQVGVDWGKFELAQCVLFTIYSVEQTVEITQMPGINKKGKDDWSQIDGSSPKPKQLHLEKEETASLYHCPIQVSDYDGFKSQGGCSTVGSFSWTKNRMVQVPKNLPMMIHRVKSQDKLPEYCLRFQFPAKLASYLRNG